jgi:hypothetical protein
MYLPLCLQQPSMLVDSQPGEVVAAECPAYG